MATSIEKLLKQKGWTGQEVGILAVTKSINAYRVADGKADAADVPDISDGMISKMLDSLGDEEEFRIYNGYVAINRWLSVQYATANAITQQAQYRFTKLYDRLMSAKMAERVYQYIGGLPLIVTEKQYQDIVQKRTEEILRPNGKPRVYNLFELVVKAIAFYVTQLKDSPDQKNPLAPLKEKLEGELVTDQRILSRYNEAMGYGYRTLPDGTRSDEISREEWGKRVLGFDVEKEIEDMDVSFKRYVLRSKTEYEGKSEEEYEQEAREKGLEKGEPAEWHYYDSPPEDLNKWEILDYPMELHSFYTSLFHENNMGGVIEDGSTDKEAINSDAIAFRKEFPSVVRAILEDMEQYFEGVSSIPVEEWADHTYRLDDLHKRGIYGLQNLTSEQAIFSGSGRALGNGIAILRTITDWGKYRIDENGYYSPPDISKAFQHLALEGLFPESESYADNLRSIDFDKTVLLDSIYFLNGYNKALELVRKKFKIEALKHLEAPAEAMSAQVEVFNNLLTVFYSSINSRANEDDELKQKKLNALKDVLTTIDLKSTKTPEAKIKIAKTWLKMDFDAFRKGDLDVCDLLCLGRIKE